jgi:hypothetical protein
MRSICERSLAKLFSSETIQGAVMNTVIRFQVFDFVHQISKQCVYHSFLDASVFGNFSYVCVERIISTWLRIFLSFQHQNFDRVVISRMTSYYIFFVSNRYLTCEINSRLL